MPKEIRKTLRFSSDEYTQILEKIEAHNLTFSEFARSAILSKKVSSKLTPDLIFQIQKIGNNLNQIAKSLNSKKGDIPNSEILKNLISIQDQIKDLKNDY